jgi:hypothetical protein
MKISIYNPRVTSDEDRVRMVQLLSRLLEERLLANNRNLPIDGVALSESENREIRRLVQSISSDRSFFVAVAFVDGLLGSKKLTEEQLREIYLSERKRRGYSRALASGTWYDFRTRLGGPSGSLSTYLRGARRMPFEHFLKMEDRLLSVLGVGSPVRVLVVSVVNSHRQRIEKLRDQIFSGSDPEKEPLEHLVQELLKQLDERRDMLSTNQIAGLATLIANTTVLFSTRDWSVAGTMSTMAGGLALLSTKT